MKIKTEIKPDNEFVLAAVKAVNSLDTLFLIQFLRAMAKEYAFSAEDLKQSWCDEAEAGKFWEKAAEGFERLADELEEEWENL